MTQAPQIRIKVSKRDHKRYRELAHRYGYEQLAPFVRHLLDSADNAAGGVITFYRREDAPDVRLATAANA